MSLASSILMLKISGLVLLYYGVTFVGRFVFFWSVLYRRFHCSLSWHHTDLVVNAGCVQWRDQLFIEIHPI